MAAVDIDRQAIERRDFPITRRGYDPAAVDAHLRALASEIEELQRERTDGVAEASLASTAGTQVQSILAAAEAAAADIEREALESARTAREDAAQDAAQTREEAIERARVHVAAVAQATSVLLERVGSMDGEVGALIDSLRAGAGRLASDLAAVETNMGELYDAASGANPEPPDAVAGASRQAVVPSPAAPPQTPAPQARNAPAPAPAPAPAAEAAAPPLPPPSPAAPPPRAPAPVRRPSNAPAVPASPAPAVENGDLDSARLIALNMALNGESRAEADRYLAENYQLADRQKLIDEVYAAIES
jgi:DivIVA domain-containing protein